MEAGWEGEEAGRGGRQGEGVAGKERGDGQATFGLPLRCLALSGCGGFNGDAEEFDGDARGLDSDTEGFDGDAEGGNGDAGGFNRDAARHVATNGEKLNP